MYHIIIWNLVILKYAFAIYLKFKFNPETHFFFFYVPSLKETRILADERMCIFLGYW